MASTVVCISTQDPPYGAASLNPPGVWHPPHAGVFVSSAGLPLKEVWQVVMRYRLAGENDAN